MKRCVVLLCLAMLLPIAEPAEGGILIDDYVVGSTILQFGAGTSPQTTSDASIYGGTRSESLSVRDLEGDKEFLGAMGYGGNLSIAQGGQDQIYGSLAYTGAPSNDLTQKGANDRFAVEMLSSSSGSPLGNVFSISATESGVTQEIFFTIPGNGELPDYVYVEFTDFTKIDFTQVDSVTLAFDFQSAPGNNVTIGSFFVTIPEPAGLTTALTGLALLLRRRRR